MQQAMDLWKGDHTGKSADTKLPMTAMDTDKHLPTQEVVTTIKGQIQQFKQKVQLCSQSFVVTELADTLRSISQKTQRPIRSVYALRSFVERMHAEKENTSDISMEQEVMYATWFLENLEYLKTLKAHFEARIYLPLTRLFNGENAFLQRQLSTLSSDSWSVLIYKDEMPEISDLYNNADMENIVTRLRYLKNRLDHLLEDEGEIDPALFSVTSAQALEGLRPPLANNAFIRLMPDIQQKMATAAILAERWLEIVTSKDSDGSTMISKLERVKTMLGDRLHSLDIEIKRASDELSFESDELQDLLAREDRSTIISNKCQSIELKVSKINEKIFQNSHQITDIKELLNTASGNKQFMSNLTSDLKKKERLHEELTQMAKILQYEQNLFTEDLCVELEIKPSLIRITNNVQDKCEELESTLEAKRLEKHQLEMALKPVVGESHPS